MGYLQPCCQARLYWCFDGLTRRDKIMRLRLIERQLLPIELVRCEEITGETEGTLLYLELVEMATSQ